MGSILEEAFGASDLNLYKDILKVQKDCSLAQLRKAFYQQALVYHPDRNPSDDAKLKFQAISWAYQLLKDPEKRADYDRDGSLPFDDDDTDNDQKSQWKSYFDMIFGKVSTNKIDEFSQKYKMSEEEEADVLKRYKEFKGNVSKMLEFVMLSEERDAQRWVEDYIKPAIESGKVPDYTKNLNKTLSNVLKKIQKKKEKDSEETETEESGDDVDTKAQLAAKRRAPKGGRKSVSKRKKSSTEDLVAAIRDKNSQRNQPIALGRRYGISDDMEDPLDDDTFAKLQAKYKR